MRRSSIPFPPILFLSFPTHLFPSHLSTVSLYCIALTVLHCENFRVECDKMEECGQDEELGAYDFRKRSQEPGHPPYGRDRPGSGGVQQDPDLGDEGGGLEGG